MTTQTGYWLHTWDVYSRTDPNKMWKVALSRTGIWGCSCPKWKFCKAPKIDCHHIGKIKKVEPIDAEKTVVMKPRSLGITGSSLPIKTYFVLQTKRVVCMEDEV